MGAHDFQFGAVDEVTFNTPVVVSRFAEYSNNPTAVRGIAGRTEGNPLRVGSRARRQSRAIPYFDHAEGSIEFDVMNKGFGFWLKHLLPNVVTTGVGPFVHTATEGGSSASIGKSFTAQLNYPLHPAGTNQAITWSGGKVPKWTLANDVDGMLTMSMDVWFASQTTATALAAASYPASMSNFAWSHGVVQVGGSSFDVTAVSIEVDQGMDLERGQIRGNTAKKEPTPGQLGVSWSLTADFDSLTQFNRVHATTIANMSASIVGTWTNGVDIIKATIPGARFDDFNFGGEAGGIMQELSGVGEYNGTDSPITLEYTTSDAAP